MDRVTKPNSIELLAETFRSSARTLGTTTVPRSSIERKIASCGWAPTDICIGKADQIKLAIDKTVKAFDGLDILVMVWTTPARHLAQ